MPRTISNGGWKAGYALDRPRLPKPAPVQKTPEEIAATRSASDELIRKFFENQASEAEARRNRGIDIIEDMKARVAVEGDTDLNHDNLEGPSS